MTGFPAALAYLALALFWVHTLLIAAAGWGECARLLRRFGGEGRPGRVLEGAGPQGQLATQRVRQVGRSKGDAAIHFHDRARESEVFGGRVAIGGEERALAPGRGEVWGVRAGLAAASRCPGAEAFAQAHPRATRAAGWERSVEVSLGPGDPVWLIEGPEGPVIAGEDPRGWRTRALAATVGLVAVLLVFGAGCTALCLWPPAFGAVSKVGAFAALVAFNLFQLFGKLHREAIQPPGSRALRGLWRDAGS